MLSNIQHTQKNYGHLRIHSFTLRQRSDYSALRCTSGSIDGLLYCVHQTTIELLVLNERGELDRADGATEAPAGVVGLEVVLEVRQVGLGGLGGHPGVGEDLRGGEALLGVHYEQVSAKRNGVSA